MKRWLPLLFLTAFLVACFTGCGSNQSKEKNDEVVSQQVRTSEKDVAEMENPESEEATAEAAASAVEWNTITVASKDGSQKLELTYNATFFHCTYEPEGDSNFYATEAFFAAIWDDSDHLLDDYTDVPKNFCGGGYLQFHTDYSAQTYYEERAESLSQYDMKTSELQKITVSGQDAYWFEEFFDDKSLHFTNVMFEVNGDILLFVLNNGELLDENGKILDVDAFLVNIKAVA